MTIGPEPMIRIFLTSVRFGMVPRNVAPLTWSGEDYSRADVWSAPPRGVEPRGWLFDRERSSGGRARSGARVPYVEARPPVAQPSSGILLHQFDKLTEEVPRVMGTRRGFRMILDAKERQRAVAHALIGLVVQIHVRDFDLARWERVGVDAKAVVLSRDFNFFR